MAKAWDADADATGAPSENVLEAKLEAKRRERDRYKRRLENKRLDKASRNECMKDTLGKVKRERDKFRKELTNEQRKSTEQLRALKERQTGFRAEANKFQALYERKRREGGGVAELQSQLVRMRKERDSYAQAYGLAVAEGGDVVDMKSALTRTRSERDKFKALHEARSEPVGVEQEKLRAAELTLELGRYKDLYKAVQDVSDRQWRLIEHLRSGRTGEAPGAGLNS